MKNYNHINQNRSGRIWSGLVLLIVGVIFFLRNFGIYLPNWIFSWPMLLIVSGIFSGFKHNFRTGGWLIMILIGGYFMIQRIGNLDFSQYYLAIVFVTLGLFLILKPASKNTNWYKRKYANFDNAYTEAFSSHQDFSSQDDFSGQQEFSGTEKKKSNENDYIDSLNIFGGSKQQIYSKDFKGGDIISFFGGCELDLRQADFTETVTLDVVAVFGGIKITVPPTWIVKTEITPIFGGVDDKRSVLTEVGEPPHIIKIKGVALFGGLTITNY